MPIGQATSADLSNNAAAMAAVYDIALNHAGLTWWGSRVGEMPLGSAVQGFPYLAVLEPELAGSITNGQFSAGTLGREPGLSEPVWECEVFGFWPYHPADSKTFTTTAAARDALVQAYTINWSLERQADWANIQTAELTNYQAHGGHKFRAVHLAVRFGESLIVTYN